MPILTALLMFLLLAVFVVIANSVRIVREYERGLFYRKGKFVELLPPGRYVHWWWEHCQIDCVDIREVSHTIEGQEILTSDKIGVRVTLIAQYKVADPVIARHSVGDYHGQLYQDLQLTLREAITGRTLEDLLKERDILSAKIQEDVAARAKKYGIEIKQVIAAEGESFSLDAWADWYGDKSRAVCVNSGVLDGLGQFSVIQDLIAVLVDGSGFLQAFSRYPKGLSTWDHTVGELAEGLHCDGHRILFSSPVY